MVTEIPMIPGSWKDVVSHLSVFWNIKVNDMFNHVPVIFKPTSLNITVALVNITGPRVVLTEPLRKKFPGLSQPSTFPVTLIGAPKGSK
jgi:hypothetical protein